MEKIMKNNVYLYIFNWITFLYNRNWHNIINQLYLSKKKILNKVPLPGQNLLFVDFFPLSIIIIVIIIFIIFLQ